MKLQACLHTNPIFPFPGPENIYARCRRDMSTLSCFNLARYKCHSPGSLAKRTSTVGVECVHEGVLENKQKECAAGPRQIQKRGLKKQEEPGETQAENEALRKKGSWRDPVRDPGERNEIKRVSRALEMSAGTSRACGSKSSVRSCWGVVNPSVYPSIHQLVIQHSYSSYPTSQHQHPANFPMPI